MQIKMNKYNFIEWTFKLIRLLFTLWCVTETINTILIYKELWPEFMWGTAQTPSAGYIIVFGFLIIPSIFKSVYHTTIGEKINLNFIINTFYDDIAFVVTLGSIITCVVQWPKTLYIIGLLLLFKIILLFHQRKQQKIALGKVLEHIGVGEKNES